MRHPLLLQQHREALRRARVRMREKAKVASRVRARPGAVASGMLEAAQGELDEASRQASETPWTALAALLSLPDAISEGAWESGGKRSEAVFLGSLIPLRELFPQQRWCLEVLPSSGSHVPVLTLPSQRVSLVGPSTVPSTGA